MRALFPYILLIFLSACEDKVRVTIKVKTADAGAATKTSSTAVP